MKTNSNTGNFGQTWEKNLFLLLWLPITWKVCLERLWSLHSWRYSKPSGQSPEPPTLVRPTMSRGIWTRLSPQAPSNFIHAVIPWIYENNKGNNVLTPEYFPTPNPPLSESQHQSTWLEINQCKKTQFLPCKSVKRSASGRSKIFFLSKREWDKQSTQKVKRK